MANPQPTDAHIRIAHSINEAIMLRHFTKRQRKVLDLVLRLSWGCGKKSAFIPRQKDFQVVGIGEGHIKAELDWLTISKVITIEGSNYSFNKNFDDWQVSRVNPFQPEKLTELVSLNLKETYQNGKSNKPELTETGSENLPKQEESTYRNRKSATPELASPKESIKENINKDIYKKRHGEFNNVLLSDEEYKKLVERLGEARVKDLIEALSLHKKSNGKRYEDDYATILNWARREDKEQRQRKSKSPRQAVAHTRVEVVN